MDYIEILEKHGIDINEQDRIEKFCANVHNIIPVYRGSIIPYGQVFSICQTLGIPISSFSFPYLNHIDAGEFIENSLFIENRRGERVPVDFKEFIVRLSILLKCEFFSKSEYLKICVESALDRWMLSYELCDGIVIPKGIEEFDKALVADVVDWLSHYPSAYQSYLTALRQYTDNDNPRDIADNLRKTFEAFLQEFLSNTKNLDNNISELGSYLKDNGVNSEIRNMFTKLIDYYKLHNDKTAKHNDDTDRNSLEFLLYQTGVFIRYLLVIKQSCSAV